ncbi:hypothetical protein KUV47_03695 [Vannielia litorea]|uniref:DUF6525 family protein n=1 Tax=Vannielia litorea TaxID=1217970 RepID=UPI001C95C367|nr:DUF6525 family protein [Vannielia litorea]MBY6152306.1 hypothetical protein [Vannielia litorea]
MTRRNAASALPRRRRAGANPMRDYDRLPPGLRLWLAGAALPWSARAVHRAFRAALARSGGCPKAALATLDRIEARLLARDAPRIWGTGHPSTAPSGSTGERAAWRTAG